MYDIRTGPYEAAGLAMYAAARPTAQEVLVGHLADSCAEFGDVQWLITDGRVYHLTRTGLATTEAEGSMGLLSGTIRIEAMIQQQVPQVRSYQG
jgi:hypothetical protein